MFNRSPSLNSPALPRSTRLFQPHWRLTLPFCSIALLTSLTGCQRWSWNQLQDHPSNALADAPPTPLVESDSRRRISRFEPKSNHPAKKLQRLAGARIQDHSNSADNHPDLVDSATPDADLDQSLADLPPALRDLLAKQVEASNKHASQDPSPNHIESDKPTWDEVKVAKSTKARDSISDKPDAPSAKKPPSEKSIVKVSLSDNPEEPNSPQVVTASSAETIVDTPPHPAPAPSADSEPEHWNRQILKAIDLLEKQIAESVATDENLKLNQEATLRMLRLSVGRLDDALDKIEGLNEKENDYFHHQLLALHEAINPDGVPVRSRRWSVVMNSQRTATDSLAALSSLDLRNLEFCTAVDGYGVLTKFPNRLFQPEQDVLLYCELENVAADPLKNGFETQLQGSYEIFDRNGVRVADQLLPIEKEVCMNRRRDYFVVYHLYLPANLAAGNYSLKLTVEDMKAKKFGQSSLDFQIGK